MPMFNATLRHEIGHAVDSQLNVMDTWGAQEVAGGWTKYGSHAEFVDGIIAASGGMSYGTPQITSMLSLVGERLQVLRRAAGRRDRDPWRDTGKLGPKAECLAYVEEVWTDMRPLSLRKKMDAPD